MLLFVRLFSFPKNPNGWAMRLKAALASMIIGVISTLVPSPAHATAPEPPAEPLFNQVQMKVLVDNDFAVFMGNDQQVTRLFYQNDVVWNSQIVDIQTLDVYPNAGETFIYLLPMGGNAYIPPGGGSGGQENFSGVLNNIALLDYPGAEVAVGRSVSDDRDIINYGYLLLNNYLTDYTTSLGQVTNGSYTVDIDDISAATKPSMESGSQD